MDIGIEIFDAMLMGCVALHLLGLELGEIAQMKLDRMDRSYLINSNMV